MKRLLLFILLCGTFGTLHAQEEAYTTRLQPIVVKPGVNPAHRIIQNAINHRDQNNPEKNQSYRCIQYSKMTFHVAEDTTARRIMARSRLPFVQPDTSGYGLMVESVMERIFAGPGRLQEKVIASKTSGFKEYQQLAMLTAALQFFHFYDEVIEWKSLNQFYLNPISPNSTERYFFSLVDTLISAQGDSTFVIDFRPSRTSNMDGLKGTLHINSHGWAIERVVAEPATAPLFPIKMEQQYRLTDAEIWFPAELSVAVSYKNFALTGLDMFYYHKSWISEVTINPDLGGRKLAAGTIVVAEDAGQHSEYIARYRAAPLSLKEWNTYQKYEHANYDWVLQIAEGATDRNSFSVKTFDIPFNQVINYNYYEGWHFGMGLYTNRRLSPRFSVGGYGRYGLKDKEVKYGVSVSLYPRKDLDSEIKLWAQNDISDLSFSREAGILGVGRWGNFYLGLQGKVRELAPLFEYSYKGQSYYRRDGLGNAQASIQLRYSIREQRSKIFRRTYAIRSDFPVFYLNYTFGLPRLLSRYGFYQKIEGRMAFNTYFRNLGRTYLSIWGGFTHRDIPVMLLFSQSYLDRTIFLSEESKAQFNAITDQIYASDQYVHVFFYHDFGPLLYKPEAKVFRPRLALAQSAGWSRLSLPGNHRGVPLKDMHKGYFESGIVIEDIIRLNYLNFFYVGLGAGLYGAYGGSVDDPFVKTLTPKVRLSVSF